MTYGHTGVREAEGVIATPTNVQSPTLQDKTRSSEVLVMATVLTKVRAGTRSTKCLDQI